MAQRSYYDVLGVSASAEPHEIKSAYRELARVYHPDHGGDRSRFEEIVRAYSVLSDPEEKRKYDLGHADIASIGDLYFRTEAGKHFLKSILPSASVASVRGEDTYMTLEVDSQLLKQGGSIEVVLNGSKRLITIPADVELRTFCRIACAGKPGRNGAPNGDLFLIVSARKEDRRK